jgi:5-methylcytosine-specific restriction endonuclease McrA
MSEKTCTKCGGPGPFGIDRSTADSLTMRCKTCRGAAARVSRQKPENRKREYATSATWRKRHPGKVAVSKAGINRRYYKRHKVQLQARSRAWYAAHAVRMIAWQRIWRREHPEVIAVQGNRRRARFAAVENTLTPQEWLLILEYFNYRCAYCLRSDVELTLDHVIAISRGGGHTAENVVPACRTDNCRKKDKPVFLMAG